MVFILGLVGRCTLVRTAEPSQPFSVPSRLSRSVLFRAMSLLPSSRSWRSNFPTYPVVVSRRLCWRPSLPLSKPRLMQSLFFPSFVVICIPLSTSVLLSHRMQSIFRGSYPIPVSPSPVVSCSSLCYSPHQASLLSGMCRLPSLPFPSLPSILSYFEMKFEQWLLRVEQLRLWHPS